MHVHKSTEFFTEISINLIFISPALNKDYKRLRFENKNYEYLIQQKAEYKGEKNGMK